MSPITETPHPRSRSVHIWLRARHSYWAARKVKGCRWVALLHGWDDVIACAGQVQDGERLRGLPRDDNRNSAVITASERGDALLDDVGGGVADPRRYCLEFPVRTGRRRARCQMKVRDVVA